MLGVAFAHRSFGDVLVAGIAGLVAGAMSMAAGEYVSVHSQSDTEQADLTLERSELKRDDPGEKRELVRHLCVPWAGRSARQASRKAVNGSRRARQAALASAASFAVGAALPLLVTWLVPATALVPFVFGSTLVFLAVLGGTAAHAGGASLRIGALRVTFLGALAMGVTAGAGSLFGTVG